VVGFIKRREEKIFSGGEIMSEPVILSSSTLVMWKAIDRVLQKLDALEKRVEEIEKELKELKEVK
jgi:vacuolar-type H+-ATPase subunit I/STV1